MKESSIYEKMEQDIYNAKMDEVEKNKLLKHVIQLKDKKINLMITGPTGCGKSSTINALFNSEVAKVGVGVDPETMDIAKYELGNLVLWDSPGLGDGKEADNRHAKNIINKLLEVDFNGNALIDLVLVILDGSSRDLGTSYELINNVIIPNLGKDKDKRIIVAINQADVAMKGRYWDYENNKPQQKLIDFLDAKVESIKDRIYEGTGVKINPIYYSAGFKEDVCMQTKPYNLSKLLWLIIKSTPKEKRLAYVDNINSNEEMWKKNDELEDYSKKIQDSFLDTIEDCAREGGYIGEDIGSVFGTAGEKVGKVVGTLVGGIVGIGKAIFRRW